MSAAATPNGRIRLSRELVARLSAALESRQQLTLTSCHLEDASSSPASPSSSAFTEEQKLVSERQLESEKYLAGINYHCYSANGNFYSGTRKSFLLNCENKNDNKNENENENEKKAEVTTTTTTSALHKQQTPIGQRKPLNCAQSRQPKIDEAKAENANEKQQLVECKAQIMSLTRKQLNSEVSSSSERQKQKQKLKQKPPVEGDVGCDERSNNAVATCSAHRETSSFSTFHVSTSISSSYSNSSKRTLHQPISLNNQSCSVVQEAGSSLIILKGAKGKRRKRRIREDYHPSSNFDTHSRHRHHQHQHHHHHHQHQQQQQQSVILGAQKVTKKGTSYEEKQQSTHKINKSSGIIRKRVREERKTATEECESIIIKTAASEKCEGEDRKRNTCKWCKIADCDCRKRGQCLLPAASSYQWPRWLAVLALALALLLPASLAQLFPAERQQRSSQQDEQLSRAVFATMLHSNEAAAIGVGVNKELLQPARNITKSDQFMKGNFTQEKYKLDGTTGNSQPLTSSSSSESLLASLEAGTTDTHTDEVKTFFDRMLEFGRIFLMGAIIVADICGNSLVILSVCRHSKLRVTTNWFVVSLACADILVALFAMTFNASVIISGRWLFQRWVCDFWNACDVLASTASILHLCCISIDRYIAIMRPLDYPMKITTRRVVYALCAVWISSALLSYIPIFTGVYTTAEHIKWLKDNPDQCEFVVNRVYALVSSSISFWIPCCIMVFTYYRIYREATRQEKFIYKAQMMIPAPNFNHHHAPNHHHHHQSGNHCSSSSRSKQRRSKSVAVSSSVNNATTKQQLARNQHKLDNVKAPPIITTTPTTASSQLVLTTNLNSAESIPAISSSQQPLGSSKALDAPANSASSMLAGGGGGGAASEEQQQQQQTKFSEPTVELTAEEQDSNSGQSTPTKRSISKMKREHKAAKTLGIIMGVFILCWLPFFSWYTPQHICGHACDGIVPKSAVTILFWIGYFNSTLNPIIYAYFNHEFRDAFKKTLQWIFCCCNDLKCLRVNRPNDNQHYNCTYRSTQEIGLVSNS